MKKRIYVVKRSNVDGYNIKLSTFKAVINEATKETPSSNVDDLVIEFYYDDETCEMSIYYEREETAQEEVERTYNLLNAEKQRDMALYNRIKEKYKL